MGTLDTNRKVKVTAEDYTEQETVVNEQKLALEAANSKGNFTGSPGLFLNGQKYMVVAYNAESDSTYLAGKNNTGGCMTKTNQTLLIGLYDGSKGDKQNKGNCNKDVEDLAAKLKGANF